MGEEVQVRARIRTLDLYSGHADGTGLSQWVKERMRIGAGIFLTHGEKSALNGSAERLATFIDPQRIHIPRLDEAFELREGVRTIAATRPRVPYDAVASKDWSNEMSRFILDLNDTIEKAADTRSKSAILRNLRRALESASSGR